MDPDYEFLSDTAYWTAAARARESSRADRLFNDPLAGVLSGELGARALAASELAAGGENPYLPIRTRWFDRAVDFHGKNVGQLVDLGAGLDARPFRMALPPKLRWFEVDLPEVFEKKEPALEALGALGACARIIVPADLRGRWSESLLGAGFEVGRPTLWLAEGLLFYLQPPTVDRLLEEAGQLSATGSRFAADVFGTALRRTRDWGPRTPFCCDDPVHLFGRAGWPEVATAQLSPGRDTATLNHAGATEGDPTNRTWLVVAAL